MADKIEQVLVPDIGGAENVDVIEIAVKPGDTVALEDPLLTLEGDKATMDVPSPLAGVIESVAVKVGDKVSEGSLVVTIKTAGSAAAPVAEKPEVVEAATVAAAETVQTIAVPDIGDAAAVDVIEVLVTAGDTVAAEDALITLEGDKATMDVPSPVAGIVQSVLVNVGDKVSQGTDIVTLLSDAPAPAASKSPAHTAAPPPKVSEIVAPAPTPVASADVLAGPAVRRIAREVGLSLGDVKGTGDKGRITREDVKRHVQAALNGGAGSGSTLGFDVLPWPTVDFEKFGPVSTAPLSKIKRISGANLHRNWISIPHITQFEEADITELEAFRQEQKSIAAQQGVKLTPLVFIMKAVVATLKEFPHFNASLDASGESLILKQYYHIGVAVDTPNGLVVPVIRDVDRKGIYELAGELADISKKAREKGLSVAEMQGGCFTISSLGGIGGTAFTPIINAPEVAILGVSRHLQKPVFLKSENQFVPRLMLPLSLSYDHRVIDGADGARFIVSLANRLSDIRRILL